MTPINLYGWTWIVAWAAAVLILIIV